MILYPPWPPGRAPSSSNWLKCASSPPCRAGQVALRAAALAVALAAAEWHVVDMAAGLEGMAPEGTWKAVVEGRGRELESLPGQKASKCAESQRNG